ncbi:MAG TPA: 3-hydroxyacyl-ACP dehydratase FabZ family protein [Polyangiaceae bacterium]|nr:3-hydroxyacyl-ACP dehydratase FabZ family protein [Polyangiaceae bacterium]
MRYFLLDKVTAYEAGRMATGIKNVTLTDEVLHDHFPDYPVLPGALVLEGMAQLAGFMLEVGKPAPVLRAVLAQIEKAKFHSPAGPGDQVSMRVSLAHELETAAQVDAEAYVSDRCIARARLTFMLRRIESPRVHEQRERLYALWTRDLRGETHP